MSRSLIFIKAQIDGGRKSPILKEMVLLHILREVVSES